MANWNNQIAVTGKVTNLGKDKFGFGNTDYLEANVKVSELRFWTKAISQTQIKENMYSIDPTTEGWKPIGKWMKVQEMTLKIIQDTVITDIQLVQQCGHQMNVWMENNK